METPAQQHRFSKAAVVFRRHGGVLRTMQAIRLGVHPKTLYGMRDAGLLEQVSRGVFRLAELPALGNPDLVTVSLRVPSGVICLISALAFHEITTQIPHEVYLALARGSEPPRLDYPPLRLFWFGGRAYREGIEEHEVDGVPVRIYSGAKTVADCFKYRNKLGLDTALEALKLYLRQEQATVEELMTFARVCRVEKVMRPYVEATL
jgi:predicted transcriptional regulator of viral defense system